MTAQHWARRAALSAPRSGSAILPTRSDMDVTASALRGSPTRCLVGSTSAGRISNDYGYALAKKR